MHFGLLHFGLCRLIVYKPNYTLCPDHRYQSKRNSNCCLVARRAACPATCCMTAASHDEVELIQSGLLHHPTDAGLSKTRTRCSCWIKRKPQPRAWATPPFSSRLLKQPLVTDTDTALPFLHLRSPRLPTAGGEALREKPATYQC